MYLASHGNRYGTYHICNPTNQLRTAVSSTPLLLIWLVTAIRIYVRDILYTISFFGAGFFNLRV